MKKKNVYNNKITKYELISIALSLLAVIATTFIGYNQIVINRYYKDENEVQKKLILLGQFDNKTQTLKIDPYSNDFHITQSKVYYISENTIKTKIQISLNGDMPIQDITDSMRQILLRQRVITKTNNTRVVVDGYPIIFENYYLYKGRQYHLYGLYILCFSAPTFDSLKNENPIITLEKMTYIRSFNRKEKIKDILMDQQAIMEHKLGL